MLTRRPLYTNLTLSPWDVPVYRMSENELPMSRLSKVIVLQTYTHTDRHTYVTDIYYAASRWSTILRRSPQSTFFNINLGRPRILSRRFTRVKQSNRYNPFGLRPHWQLSDCVRCGQTTSDIRPTYLTSAGVSPLGPILFCRIHRRSNVAVRESHGLSPHNICWRHSMYGSCQPTVVAIFTANVFECVEAATGWMSDRLYSLIQTYMSRQNCSIVLCDQSASASITNLCITMTDACCVSLVLSARDMGIYKPIDCACRCGRMWRQLYCDALPLDVSHVTYPSLSTNSHAPHADGRLGPFTTGLYSNAVLVGLPSYLRRRL